jgi:hypothetical protein
MAATSCVLESGDSVASSEMRVEIQTDQAAASRYIVPGLTQVRMPAGYERGTDEIQQAGTIAYDNPTRVKRTPAPFNLDFYPTDYAQYELYQRGLCQQDKFNDIWFYQVLNLADRTQDQIWIPNDELYPNLGVSVQNFDLPAVDLNSHYMVNGVFLISTSFLLATEHIFDVAVPTITFTASSILDSASGFDVTKIFPGDKVFIDDTAAGLTNFRRIVTVDTVIAGQIDTVETDLAVDAVGAATTVLRIGRQW